jgi:L,D-peptidoglycan transpeptidase YkuD (ErfK/YbiS/YcfS/YnhG family)
MRLIRPSLFLLLIAMTASASSDPLRDSRQCIVVLAPNLNSKTGVLRAFERTSADSDWNTLSGPVPVVLGKKGLAWGRGLLDPASGAPPGKIEGDNKAPAGIFQLGPAFGYAPAKQARWIKLRYVPLTNQTEGIDDPRSRYYNRLVDRSKVARVDWRTSEQMLRADDLYKWGVFVAHNSKAQPGAGSCIFLHIWKNSATPTTGCTAMAERDLVQLLRGLDPAAQPVLAQMPARDYATFQSSFALPIIPEKRAR